MIALDQKLEKTLLGPDGYALCEFLRAFYYREMTDGSVPTDALSGSPESGARLAEALRLDLVSSGPAAQLRLTAAGYEVANFAKEYCNWIDKGRILPEGVAAEMLPGRRVLDVGCSFGRHMASFERHGARPYGVELQGTYLQLSRLFAKRERGRAPDVAQGRGESLPFRTGTFDLVLCRLVLNYVLDMEQTLSELARVLAPNGVLVLLVEEPGERLRLLYQGRWHGNWRAQAFNALGLLNTVLLQFTGRQVRVKKPGRMHAQHSPAWPSIDWLSKQLARRRLVPYQGITFAPRDGPPGLLRGRLEDS